MNSLKNSVFLLPTSNLHNFKLQIPDRSPPISIPTLKKAFSTLGRFRYVQFPVAPTPSQLHQLSVGGKCW